MSRSLGSLPLRSVLDSLLLNGSRQQARRLASSAATTSPARTSSHLGAATPRRPVLAPARFAPQLRLPAGERRGLKTIEEAKSRYRSGPFSWKAGLLFVITAAGLVWYFDHEKERMRKKRIADSTKGIGKPKIGGDFSLTDQHGRPFSSADLRGRYSLVYFGFSHCPDICPEELDKMAAMFDLVQAARPDTLVPVFVTCDPARDTPKVLKDYLAEFHERFVGLTGTYDQIKAMCKAYRVYFSTPTDVKPGQDYLVDHSIYFYLMDPQGDFVEALGRQHSPEQAAKIILDHIKEYKGELRS
ncbi:hypothetical protein MAPG_02505 [Magnaporthiopsis poae ATCC 64411]|uniref:Thioredoxin domain-containing protein n=1 Tax=Magnaporthiopsis poae (strain ATCC 64411 / 73-15) TaxID=644358 RepID=A0A0C4DRJ5_MAGP6|nr:hypothetical protein MAPG_02505 [Magnaporthiopsis poae ATCC 64411]